MGLTHALIFDLDGTLWDTTEVVAQAWNVALERAHLQDRISARHIASIMGLTHDQIFPRLFPNLTRAQQENLSAYCYEEEERLIRRHGGQLYAGVREGLLSWARRLPLAIVSNCQQGYIELFLEWSELGSCFVDWECHGNTGHCKGDNLRALMQRRQWPTAVYVGDTAGDEAAAQQAGSQFVFCRYGFGQASPEARSIDSFSQLDAHLLGTGIV